MDQYDQWGQQLLEVGELLEQAHGILAELQRDLKESGKKKDAQALGEPLDRLARYGRLFEEMRQSWSDPDQ